MFKNYWEVKGKATFIGFRRNKALFLSEHEDGNYSVIYKNRIELPWQFILPVVISFGLFGFLAPILIVKGADLIPRATTEIAKILEVRHD